MGEIDWDVELRKIEREYSGLPPEPSPGSVRAKQEAEKRARVEQEMRRGRLGVYARLVPAIALSIAIVFWPYPTACGPHLLGFLGAIGAVGVGGLWIAFFTWRFRMPKTHVVAMLIVIWGLTMAATVALPRLGVPEIGLKQTAAWRCS